MSSQPERTQSSSRLSEQPLILKIALVMFGLLALASIIASQLIRGSLLETANELAFSQLDTLSRSQAYHVIDTINNEILVINRLSSNAGLQARMAEYITGEISSDDLLVNDEVLTAQLENFRSTNSEFDTLAVVTTEGQILAVSPAPANPGDIDPTEWEWLDEVVSTGSPRVYNPAQENISDTRDVRVIVPVFDESSDSGEVIGVVYTVWDMTNLLGLVQPAENQEGLLVRIDGRILISGTEERGDSLNEELIEQFASAEIGSFQYTDLASREWLYSYTNLTALEGGSDVIENVSWLVAIRTPSETAQVTARFLFRRIMLILLAYSLMLVVLSLIIIQQMLRPLGQLTEAAKSIRGGDLDAFIPDLPRDEVGELAEVMNELVSQLFFRVRRLQAAVQISSASVQTLDIDEVLGEVSSVLTDQFDYLDARVYLIDQAGRRAWLRAASGTESQRLLQARHNVQINESSIVGRAIMLNEPQIGRGRDTMRRAGSSFRRTEVAVPMRAASRALGALYVSSERLGAIDQEDIDLLTLITDQLAASVENARLFEQSVANLEEIEALNRRLTRQAWEDYLSESGDLRHTLDPDEHWPHIADTVLEQNNAKAEIYSDAQGRNVLAVPLILRGEAVGSLAVTRPSHEQWSNDEIILIESVASRMGMIAEGIRLVEESTQRAAREQRVNEVSAELLQRAASVDSVLQAALNELGGALGTNTVSLRLGGPPIDTDRQIVEGDSAPASAAPGQHPPASNGDGETSA